MNRKRKCGACDGSGRAVVDKGDHEDCLVCRGTGHDSGSAKTGSNSIARMRRESIEDEREECAKIADYFAMNSSVAKTIAKAIRERGGKSKRLAKLVAARVILNDLLLRLRDAFPEDLPPTLREARAKWIRAEFDAL